jgi:hypothetical protein
MADIDDTPALPDDEAVLKATEAVLEAAQAELAKLEAEDAEADAETGDSSQGKPDLSYEADDDTDDTEDGDYDPFQYRPSEFDHDDFDAGAEHYEALAAHLAAVAGITDEKRQVRIIEAERKLTMHLAAFFLDDMNVIGIGVADIQDAAMRASNSNKPRGRQYNKAWVKLATPAMRSLTGTDRAAFIYIAANWDRVENWYWRELDVEIHDDWKWHSPATLWRHFEAWRRKADGEPEPVKQKKPGLREANVKLTEERDRLQAENATLRRNLEAARQYIAKLEGQLGLDREAAATP